MRSPIYNTPAALFCIIGTDRLVFLNGYIASFQTGHYNNYIPIGVFLGYFQVLNVTKEDEICFPLG